MRYKYEKMLRFLGYFTPVLCIQNYYGHIRDKRCTLEVWCNFLYVTLNISVFCAKTRRS